MRLPAFLYWNYSIVALIIGSLLVLSSIKVQSQNVSNLNQDSALFLNRLEKHFINVQNSKTKEAESFIQLLKIKWQSDFFSAKVKSQIYMATNKMLQNKMAAIPYFSDYFKTLIHLIERNDNSESIYAWLNAAQYILENKNYQEFSSFIRASDKFFTQKIIFSDQSTKWIASTNNYTILFQNDTLKYFFPETELVCYAKRDSSNIIKTHGFYFPFSHVWEGEGGKVTWERANYPKDSVYAELKQYSIPMQYSSFSADSVLFHHRYYFDKPILGKLEEQVLASRRGSNAIYPKFKSYEKMLEIPNIFPNIDFIGGILIEGFHLLGFGDDSSPASLTINKNDTAFVKLRSTNFSILPNQIRSAYSSISIRYKNDSIYHSGLRMSYSKEDQLLSLYREDEGLTANPFYDTYHQINMYVETVYWKMDENKIRFDMTMGRIKSSAFFESSNYFSVDRFNRLQGIDSENPLLSIKRYADKNYSKTVYFDEYAPYLLLPKEQVQLLLLKMAHEGFLFYDASNKRAELTDKIDFYLNAFSGKVDSDVIRFQSKPTKNEANAYLQIDNFDLQINGLDQIMLSDSQNLIIEPSNHSIVMRKNKDFSFDGKVTAGRLSFATTKSTFNYDEFKLDMPSIDSLWFWVKGPQSQSGGFERKDIQTAIYELSGDLLIDHPNNKSGSEPRNEYPIFTSTKDSYVYYNNKSIQGGVYTKKDFYFHLNPFTFTSLNNFNPNDIVFAGYLASSGIFPDISQVLTIQEDYSLGFTEQLPPEGIMAYGNKGRFYNKISLSNQGLKGEGILTFINSTTTSKEFLFLPDSVNTFAQSFELKPTISPVEFPRIKALNTYQHWMPSKETMQINAIDEQFSIYDDETLMKGNLVLQPTSLSGKGVIQFKEAKMSSDKFIFKNQTFESQKTNFIDIGNILNNFSARANYNDRTITFNSNDGNSKVEFPENQYICYMDQVTWYMDKEITDYSSSLGGIQNQYGDLTLRQLADTEYKGSYFISTHPQQDSLRFSSTSAQFNSKEKIIEAKGVYYLKIADAVIFPEQSKITILKNAEIIPLVNSKLITNAATKYHEINNASITIKSRKSYSGSGDYIYIDRNSERYPIHFQKIGVDATYQTIAHREILEGDYFALSPEFYFRGDVNLKASRKLLEFDGGFRIADKCVRGQNWIKFSSEIDPQNIMIPIDIQPIVPDISRQQKFVGILNSETRQKNYSAFLNNKIDYFDPLLLTAHGFIKYDESSKEFRISSKEKLNQMIRPDNYFSMKSEDCSTYGEGKINLDVNFTDLLIESYGNIQMTDSIASIRLGAAIDFHFSEDALKFIYDQFAATTLDLVDNSSAYYSKMISGFLGMDETEQYLGRQLIGNLQKTPPRLKHTIFLNDLKMKWNPKLGAYISEGKIGIENLNEYPVNALVDGTVEIKKSRSGDELIIYFKINAQWYFFKYANNIMQVLSSNDTFNEFIRSDMNSKSEKNRLKQVKGTEKRSNYRYILCKTSVKDDFLNQFKN